MKRSAANPIITRADIPDVPPRIVDATSVFNPAHNMDRLLHRGRYALAAESTATWKDARTLCEKLGFSRDFTGGDRAIAYVTLSWPLVWTIIFVIVTFYGMTADIPTETWLAYWHGWTWFVLGSAVLVTLWFTIGGIFDMKYLFRQLRSRTADPSDDGRVETIDPAVKEKLQ